MATADELHFQEAELIRVVRVACVQRAIAMQLAKDNRGLVNASGQPVMPAGPVDLSRPIAWRCPLCDSEVPSGVKHKHTAAEWMTGKRVLPDAPGIGEGDNAIGPPAGELEEAAREAMSRVAPLGSVPPEEPPTLDEGAKRRERGAQECTCAFYGEKPDGSIEHAPDCPAAGD